MATRKEKVNAGLFVLIGVLTLGGSIAIVAGLSLESSGEPYLIKIPKSVGGLREGATVRYLGVPVGRVTNVDFPADDLESVRVMIEVTRPSTPMHEGTFAKLSSNFLTGETAIELEGGGNGERRLLPLSIIEWRPTTLMRLEDALPSALDDIKQVVAQLNDLLGPENRRGVGELIGDARALAQETTRRLGPLEAEVRALREALAGASERIAAAAAGLRGDVGESVRAGVAELSTAARSIDAVAKRLDGVVGDVAAGAGELPSAVAAIRDTARRLGDLATTSDALLADNRTELRDVLIGLRDSARSLAALLEQLDRNPSHLLFSAPPEEHVRGRGAGEKPRRGEE